MNDDQPAPQEDTGREPPGQRRDAGGRFEAHPEGEPLLGFPVAEPEPMPPELLPDFPAKPEPTAEVGEKHEPSVDDRQYQTVEVSMSKGNHQHYLDEGWETYDVPFGADTVIYRRPVPKEAADGQPVSSASA